MNVRVISGGANLHNHCGLMLNETPGSPNPEQKDVRAGVDRSDVSGAALHFETRHGAGRGCTPRVDITLAAR